MIKNVGAGVSVMLQFKAPWATSQPDDLYKFSINETQHQALECLANQHPGRGVLCFSAVQQVEQSKPARTASCSRHLASSGFLIASLFIAVAFHPSDW